MYFNEERVNLFMGKFINEDSSICLVIDVFQTLDDFFTNLERICGTGSLEVVLKKTDKKKERSGRGHV